MAFSRGAGNYEGACLVLAHSVREAKRIAWASPSFLHDICDGEYTDLAVRLMRTGEDTAMPLANQDMLKAGEPHLVESPEFCGSCGWWGGGLTDEGLCGHCNEPPGDALQKLFAEHLQQDVKLSDTA